jgi:putative MFS transporter
MDPILTSKSVMFCYLGFVVGDFGSGLISQRIKSRNRAIKLFVGLNFVVSLIYLFFMKGMSSDLLYFMCFLLGATGGYWAVVVTMAAEQFGTNLRATVATTVPNFIRFAVVPMSLLFIAMKPSMGMTKSAFLISVLASGVAFVSIFGLKESFGKELDFVEPV